MNFPNPDNYIKLFSIKESLFSCYPEMIQRESMEIDGYPNIRMVYIDGQFYFHKEDLKKYNFPDERIKESLDIVKTRSENFAKFSSELSKDYTGVSDEEVDRLIERAIELWSTFVRVVDVPVYISHYFEEKVLNLMYKHGFSGHDFDVLTHPLYNTFHQRRKKDFALLKLGKMSKEEFIKKWDWSEMVLYQKKFIDDQFIEEQLNNIADPKAVIKELDENHKKAEKEYDGLYERLPQELKGEADLIQKFLYIRDYRFEMAIRGSFATVSLFEEVAKRRKITYEELIFSTPPEIIEKKLSPDVHKRMEAYVFYKGKVYVGEDVERWMEVFNKKRDIDFVEGKGVSKGKVNGRAKIVMTADKVGKIEEGDIIVCDITTPDYMHALHKVSGIVANIGGFTSHSAIVAREFNIPCVVGTGNATSVFKDNDLIEVDADKGVVRKIE